MTKMKVLTVANRKGGVAKTTTAFHIGHDCAERGGRVLFIDADNGAGLTFVIDEYRVTDDFNGIDSSSFFLRDIGESPEIPVVKTFLGGGSISLLRSNKNLVDIETRKDLLRFIVKNLSRIEEKYDLVVFDTSPNLNAMLLAVLGASTHVVVPSGLSKIQLMGVRELINHIVLVQKNTNPNLRFLGILPSRVNSRSAIEKRILGEFKAAYGSLVLPNFVIFRSAYEQAMDESRPVWQGRMSGTGQVLASKEMREVCQYINKQIGRK